MSPDNCWEQRIALCISASHPEIDGGKGIFTNPITIATLRTASFKSLYLKRQYSDKENAFLAKALQIQL
jgi:hypothetical protein